MDIQKYWNDAVSFDEYINVAEERASNNPDKNDEHQAYYDLGLQRMTRALKTFKIDEDQLSALKNKNFNGKILIVSEPWCGDASASVPVISKFFEGHNEVKIFFRDQDQSLINEFLTNGSQSIPKVLILNEDFSVKNVWGPRPKFGFELLQKFKKDPENYPREEFYNDLQVYYAKNRGKDIIEEIIELL